jgi:hypothetical protein
MIFHGVPLPTANMPSYTKRSRIEMNSTVPSAKKNTASPAVESFTHKCPAKSIKRRGTQIRLMSYLKNSSKAPSTSNVHSANTG